MDKKVPTLHVNRVNWYVHLISGCPIVSLSKTRYPHRLVQVGYRNGFEHDFTIEPNQIEGFMEENSLVKSVFGTFQEESFHCWWFCMTFITEPSVYPLVLTWLYLTLTGPLTRISIHHLWLGEIDRRYRHSSMPAA